MPKGISGSVGGNSDKMLRDFLKEVKKDSSSVEKELTFTANYDLNEKGYNKTIKGLIRGLHALKSAIENDLDIDSVTENFIKMYSQLSEIQKKFGDEFIKTFKEDIIANFEKDFNDAIKRLGNPKKYKELIESASKENIKETKKVEERSIKEQRKEYNKQKQELEKQQSNNIKDKVSKLSTQDNTRDTIKTWNQITQESKKLKEEIEAIPKPDLSVDPKVFEENYRLYEKYYKRIEKLQEDINKYNTANNTSKKSNNLSQAQTSLYGYLSTMMNTDLPRRIPDYKYPVELEIPKNSLSEFEGLRDFFKEYVAKYIEYYKNAQEELGDKLSRYNALQEVYKTGLKTNDYIKLIKEAFNNGDNVKASLYYEQLKKNIPSSKYDLSKLDTNLAANYDKYLQEGHTFISDVEGSKTYRWYQLINNIIEKLSMNLKSVESNIQIINDKSENFKSSIEAYNIDINDKNSIAEGLKRIREEIDPVIEKERELYSIMEEAESSDSHHNAVEQWSHYRHSDIYKKADELQEVTEVLQHILSGEAMPQEIGYTTLDNYLSSIRQSEPAVETISESAKKARQNIEELQKHIENLYFDVPNADPNGIVSKILFGKDGKLKSAEILKNEVSAEIKRILDGISKDYNDKGIVYSHDDYIKKFTSAFKKMHVAQQYGLFRSDDLGDPYISGLFKNWEEQESSWKKSYDKLGDYAATVYGSLIQEQEDLNIMQRNGGEDYIHFLEEAENLTKRIQDAKERNASFKQTDFDNLEITQEEADEKAKAYNTEREALEELFSEIETFGNKYKEFLNIWESPGWRIIKGVDTEGLRTMSKLLGNDADKFSTYTLRKRQAQSTIFSDNTDFMLNKNTGVTREIEDAWEKVDDAIRQGELTGEQAIKKFKEKAEELGYTFDETAKKWLQITNTGNSTGATTSPSEEAYSNLLKVKFNRDWNHGSGQATINLDEVFEKGGNQDNYKRVLEFVKMAEDDKKAAQELYNYFVNMIGVLEREKKVANNYQERNKIGNQLDKYYKYTSSLHQEYGFEEIFPKQTSQDIADEWAKIEQKIKDTEKSLNKLKSKMNEGGGFDSMDDSRKYTKLLNDIDRYKQQREELQKTFVELRDAENAERNEEASATATREWIEELEKANEQTDELRQKTLEAVRMSKDAAMQPSSLEVLTNALNEQVETFERVGEKAKEASEKKDKHSESDKKASTSAREVTQNVNETSDAFEKESEEIEEVTEKLNGYIRVQRGDFNSDHYSYVEAIDKVTDKKVTHSVDEEGNSIDREEKLINYDKLAKEIVETDTKILDLEYKISKASQAEQGPLNKNLDILKDRLKVYEELLGHMIEESQYAVSDYQKETLDAQRKINKEFINNNNLAKDAATTEKERAKAEKERQKYQEEQQRKFREDMLKREEADRKAEADRIAKEEKKRQEDSNKSYAENLRLRKELADVEQEIAMSQIEGTKQAKNMTDTYMKSLNARKGNLKKAINTNAQEHSKATNLYNEEYTKNNNKIIDDLKRQHELERKIAQERADKVQKANTESEKEKTLLETYTKQKAAMKEANDLAKENLKLRNSDSEIDQSKLLENNERIRQLGQEIANNIEIRNSLDKEDVNLQQDLVKFQTKLSEEYKEALSNQNKIDATQHNKDAVKLYKELIGSAKEYYELSINKTGDDVSPYEIQKLDELIKKWEKAKEAKDEYAVDTKGSDSSIKELKEVQDSFNNIGAEVSDSIRTALLKQMSKYEKYDVENKALGEVAKRIDNIRKELIDIRNNGLDLTNPADVARVKQIREDLEYVNSNKGLAEFKRASETRIKQLQLQIRQFQNNNTAMGSEFAKRFEALYEQFDAAQSIAQVDKLKMQFSALEAEVVKAGKTGNSFFTSFVKQLKSANAQLIATYFSLQDFIRYIREAAQTVVQIDSALTELRKVSDASSIRLQENFYRSSETAKELGTTISDVINITSDWARLGYNVDQAEELARVTTLFKTVGDNMSADDASSFLVSSLQGFQMATDEAEHIIDVYNEVAKYYWPNYIVIYN